VGGFECEVDLWAMLEGLPPCMVPEGWAHRRLATVRLDPIGPVHLEGEQVAAVRRAHHHLTILLRSGGRWAQWGTTVLECDNGVAMILQSVTMVLQWCSNYV
jgi:hypothetical protein